jgi:3-hydroxyethyl bacteriochlorophyllide a dehydrogenase
MADMQAVKALVADGRLSLKGLISHHASAALAPAAYERAFTDPSCIKMALDWRTPA